MTEPAHIKLNRLNIEHNVPTHQWHPLESIYTQLYGVAHTILPRLGKPCNTGPDVIPVTSLLLNAMQITHPHAPTHVTLQATARRLPWPMGWTLQVRSCRPDWHAMFRKHTS